jgi:hypothetical protein
MNAGKKKGYRCFEPFSNRSVQRSISSLPPNPKLDSKSIAGVAEDTRSTEATHYGSTDDKIHALRQYRHACGLCDRCAEKWTFGHKCANTIQLHVIQEMLDLFTDADEAVLSAEGEFSEEPDSGQLCMFLSEAVVLGSSLQVPCSCQGLFKDVL